MPNKDDQKHFHFSECQELGLGFWECPTSMFLFMSVLTAVSLVATYLIANRLGSPEIAIGSITAVTIVMMIINFSINHGVGKAAQSKRYLEDTNAKLEKALAKVREADKAKEEFTYMIVHDLRSPLNGIRMLSEMIMGDSKKLRRQSKVESTRLINHSANHMLMLVNDLLDFSKLEAGRFRVKKRQQKIDDTLHKTVSYFLPMADSKDIRFNTNIQPDLPLVEFDNRGLEQVLQNLLSNALKFTQAGQINLDVFLHKKGKEIAGEAKKGNAFWAPKDKKLNRLGNSVVVALSDTGSGIKQEEQKKLFQKYMQTKQAEKVLDKGTGLGLVISKGIIEAHEGVIGLQSEEGQGTTIYFTLPLIN
ncbi:MAG: HAMP domain-containing sensor histidine kinase [Patescibacteria group bacterium]